MSVSKGLEVARRFNGTRYAAWRAGQDEIGPPLWTNRIPSVEEMRRDGAVCATVPNVMLLANGKQPPKWNGWLKGGTGSYGKIYDPQYGFNANAHYEAGTLFGSPYLGERLDLQGHVAVALTSGVNPVLLQSDTGLGWNESRRLHGTLNFAKFTYAVPPGVWLGEGGKPVDNPLFGIDIHPEFQAGLNFQQVARQGYTFAICKATQGARYIPRNFLSYYRSIEASGLIPGLYHFLDATASGVVQARHFVLRVKEAGGHKGKLIAVDFEPFGNLTPGNHHLKSFMVELRQHIGNHPVLLYTNAGFWNSGESSGSFAQYGADSLWVARYANIVKHEDPKRHYRDIKDWSAAFETVGGKKSDFWQFTSTGKVAGQYIDVNTFRGTRTQLEALAGKSNIVQPPTPTPEAGYQVIIGNKDKPLRKDNAESIAANQSRMGRAAVAREIPR